MKNTALMIFSAVLLLTGCGQQGDRHVERPQTTYRNTRTIEIAAVTVNDTATIVNVEAYFRAGWWIQIASDTYIQAGGKKYPITGAGGIELDERHTMPESGEDSFTLWFPPLPKGVKSFDFIESDCDDCFKIYGIDLTGKAGFKSAMPRNVRDIRTPQEGDVIPAAELAIAETQVDIYLHGIPAGVTFGVPEGYISNFLTGTQEDIKVSDLGDGHYSFGFTQYGPATAILRIEGSQVKMVLKQGDEVAVHIDIPALGHNKSRYNEGDSKPFASFTGAYALLNNEMNMGGEEFDCSDIYPLLSDPDIWKLSEAGYRDMVKGRLAEFDARLDAADLSPQLRQYYSLSKNNLAAQAMLTKGAIYRYSEATDKGVRPGEIEYREVPSTNEDLEMLAGLGLNDIEWMTHYNAAYNMWGFTRLSEPQVDVLTGGGKGLLHDLRLTRAAFSKVDTADGATDEELANLELASAPFYKEAYERMVAEIAERKRVALEQGGFTIAENPDVAGDKVLDAILAEYKGQPVFVDFWATWCGPCLQAMKTIKPLKPEMAEHGVVTIYISNPSSPEAKWMGMLPEIGGIHYYLTTEQWSALTAKYEIRGIPQYMIFDKEGNKTYQTAGFPGVDKMRGELEKVW